MVCQVTSYGLFRFGLPSGAGLGWLWFVAVLLSFGLAHAPQRALWRPVKGLCGRDMLGGQCMEVEGLGFLILVQEICEG